ncbi:MAG: HAMP domain-containing sensor histidine kinase [Pseudomonadota bacterium]
MQLRRDSKALEAEAAAKVAPPPDAASSRVGWFGLPSKLLVLTLLFVMLAEVLIFVPSIASFRVNWLQDRLTSARIAAFAAEAAEGGQVPERLRAELTATAQVSAIAIKTDNIRRLILPADRPLAVDASFDLMPMDQSGWQDLAVTRLAQIRDAMYVFFAPKGRMIRAYGVPPTATSSPAMVEIILAEQALYDAMLRQALNILVLSIIISLFAAALVYISLNRVLVRPMTRIADNMVRFGAAPEDPERVIPQSGRRDEIGVAERELAHMQGQLRQALQQKNRLAQLGLAVSKINHDMRNMLASAQLISDRLGSVQDPTVQRFAPKLIASLDRAINFCNDTLRFGRAQEADPRRDVMALAPLLDDVADSLDLPRDGIEWQTDVPDGLQVDADRDHLHRVLNNLCRNAVDVLDALVDDTAADPRAHVVRVSARRDDLTTVIRVADSGPGVPDRARAHLFQAFKGSVRAGGTGLGLAIAAELIRAHGGTLALAEAATSGPLADGDPGTRPATGAVFEIRIPDRRTGPA